MLRRRKRLRSGIERVPARKIEPHKKWVRGLECAVPGCSTGAKITFAHVKGKPEIPYEDRGGTALKARDYWGRPLCSEHHTEEEGKADEFDHKYAIDRLDQAKWCIRNSPHIDRETKERLLST